VFTAALSMAAAAFGSSFNEASRGLDTVTGRVYPHATIEEES